MTGDFSAQGPILADFADTGFTQVDPIVFLGGGSIGGDAIVTLSAQNITTFSTASGTAGLDTMALEASIYPNGSGTIGGHAVVTVSAFQNISAPGTAFFTVANGNFMNTGGGIINGEAQINVAATNFSVGTLFDEIYNYGGGRIGNNATITLGVSSDVTVANDAFVRIFNYGIAEGGGSGSIGESASVDLVATNFSIGAAFSTEILNHTGGLIGSDATITLSAGILNADSFSAHIDNSGLGGIGGDAVLSFNVTNSSVTGEFSAEILNQGGTVSGAASIGLVGGNLTAGSLVAEIDNSSGGVVGTSTSIASDFTGSVTVSTDATYRILGTSATTPAAAITINGGTYDVGGTFLTSIADNGAITFNGANVHADIVKVGALGANGTLTIGGGSISGDTLLKLYAPGSNGSIDFVSNVTLSGQSAGPIIAANKVTIFDGVVVSIGGRNPALVFTNIANYTDWGGNGSTSGTFAGAGATTEPLGQAPPFDDSSGLSTAPDAASGDSGDQTAAGGGGTPSLQKNVGSGGKPKLQSRADSDGVSGTSPRSAKSGGIERTSGRRSGTAINVNNTQQLRSLLDAAAPGPDGKVNIPAPSNGSRTPQNHRLFGRSKVERGAMDSQKTDNGVRTRATTRLSNDETLNVPRPLTAPSLETPAK